MEALIIFGLIIINVIVFILPYIFTFGGIYGNSFNNFIALGWKNNADIISGEYYRLLTSTFLHGSFLHIFVNMYSLFNVGPIVSQIYSPFAMLIIYLSSGIGGSLASFIFSPNNSLGASGSIFGLVGALIYASIAQNDTGVLYQLVGVVLINVFIASMPGSNIDNWGHLGGLLTGFGVAIIIHQVIGFNGFFS